MKTTEEALESMLEEIQHTLLVVRLKNKDNWTIRDIAAYLGMSTRQAHRLTSDLPHGTLPYSKTKIFRRDDVLRLIKRSQVQVTLPNGAAQSEDSGRCSGGRS